MRALAVIVALAACGSPPRKVVISASAPSEYPGVIHDPKTLPQNFMVRQTLTIRAKHEGKLHEGELDAVLQKQGDTLLIIGFGPMNAKGFTLSQKGDRIEFEQFMGPKLPFSPRNVVVDVHRIYFKRLPPPTQPNFMGVIKGELDGEHVEETWQDGQLRGAVFTRPGSKMKGAVRIEFGEGCAPSHCEPESALLTNEWFDYTLAIVNESYERL